MPKVKEEGLKWPSSVIEYTMRNTMVGRATKKIARIIRSLSGRSGEEFSGFDMPTTLAGRGVAYRAALLAASAVATASRSLRTDATREARSERTRSVSSSPASSMLKGPVARA